MSTKSIRNHKKGERDVGRLFLRKGYTAWRTSQNRQSKLDDESDDVSANMIPEHARCDKHGNANRHGQYLDPYYFDRASYPNKGEVVLSIEDEFTSIPNLTIEVKNGYKTKTYNKKFSDWLEKLIEETPEGNIWALFWRRNYASRYEYRVCYERPTPTGNIRIMTINGQETLKAIDDLYYLSQQALVTPTDTI